MISRLILGFVLTAALVTAALVQKASATVPGWGITVVGAGYDDCEFGTHIGHVDFDINPPAENKIYAVKCFVDKSAAGSTRALVYSYFPGNGLAGDTYHGASFSAPDDIPYHEGGYWYYIEVWIEPNTPGGEFIKATDTTGFVPYEG